MLGVIHVHLLPLRQNPRFRHELSNKPMSTASKLHLPVCSPQGALPNILERPQASSCRRDPSSLSKNLQLSEETSSKQPGAETHQLKGDILLRTNPQLLLMEQMYPKHVMLLTALRNQVPVQQWGTCRPCSKGVSSLQAALQGWGASFLLPCLKSTCALCMAETCREDCRNLGQREDFPASASLCNGCWCWRAQGGLLQLVKSLETGKHRMG